MKKIYFIALAAFVGTSVMAQVPVTFQVDMNGQTVAPEGVHVAGNWQAAAGYDGDWMPGESEMTDPDTDGIYSLQVVLPAGSYEFKFINGNDWPGVEGVPAVSQKGGGNDNRFFTITQWHGENSEGNPDAEFVLPAVEFGGSAPEGKVAVRLQIDMSNQDITPDGVHVAGDAIVPNWTPEHGTATESANNRYAYVTHVDPDATYSYKFINGNFWGSDETAPEPCGVDGNRVFTVESDDLILDAFCFGTCELCAPQTEVTFNVDMTLEGGGNPDGVSVAGAFQNWAPGETLLTDDDADGIYSATILIDQGTYQYKFINGIAWGDDESVPPACNVDGNRQIEVGADPMVVTYCFAQCTSECIDNPDPANITFRVNMNLETVSEDGVWVMGDFTDPTWQTGALQMSDSDGDGIYEATALVSGSAERQYKYANGTPTEIEETHDFLTDGCGVSNGLGGFNRIHVRSGEDEVLTAYYYNSCDALVNTHNVELGKVTVFPNPTSNVTYIDIENPNRHTLRMSIVDITGKTVRENILINSSRVEINTSNLNAGIYFLNVTNERSERAVYKLMVK